MYCLVVLEAKTENQTFRRVEGKYASGSPQVYVFLGIQMTVCVGLCPINVGLCVPSSLFMWLVVKLPLTPNTPMYGPLSNSWSFSLLSFRFSFKNNFKKLSL